MSKRQAKVIIRIAASLCFATAAVNARADVYYEVGPSQTYATIQAALIATPWNFSSQPQPVFTENHVINIHAGTYARFETDFNSRLNGQVSRTSLTNRLIIQANIGDVVVINDAASSQIRESHVTVQGLKFTGISANPNGYYILIGTGGFTPANRQRGGIIVRNCEFEGTRGLKGYAHGSYNGLEPGVDFAYAFINNYVHNFETHYEVPGDPAEPRFIGGNLYANWGTLGGCSIFRPTVTATSEERWYLNNTLYTTNGNLTGAIRVSATNASTLVFANNLVYWSSPVANQWHYFFDVTPDSGYWPALANNLNYLDTAARWGRSAGATYTTLTQWTNFVAGAGGNIVNLVDSDPLFLDAAGGDFAIPNTSPAYQTGDADAWDNALASIGITDLLGYWNPVRDPGYDSTHANIGAMKGPPPPPAGTVISIN